jgi:O-antigen/teichoic acid export membrane protein
MLVSATRFGMFLLLASGVPLLIFARPVLAAWVGADYGIHASLILRVLIVANIIRLSAVPYAMLLVGTGQQRLVIVSPLIEGFSNLLVSVIGGALWGAIGVAIGTLVGATVGILCNFVYNMPRSTKITAKRMDYFVNGYLRPLICMLPFLLVPFLRRVVGALTPDFDIFSMIFATTLTLGAIWMFGFSSDERRTILSSVGVESGDRARTGLY